MDVRNEVSRRRHLCHWKQKHHRYRDSEAIGQKKSTGGFHEWWMLAEQLKSRLYKR
jgi:hypothetical protein